MTRLQKVATSLIAATLMIGCSSDVFINGGGATFPYPLYSRWMSDYTAQHDVAIDYQSIGSGGGIRQFSEKILDFGASDGPMSDEEMSRALGGEVMHIPTVLGAVAIAYNIPDFTDTLMFDAALISDIFMGKVTRWNDPRVAVLNPSIALPALDITVVHRSDGSGTTYVFTDYLSKVSAEWSAGPGKGKDVSWPTGIGGQGNEQVAGQVKQTPGSIGYIESVYALQNRVLVGKVKNSSGNFVAPTSASISAAAAEAVATLPAGTDYRVSIVDPPGPGAYPIASFTWLLVYKNQEDRTKGRALVEFIKWALTDGQTQAAELSYGPLPESMRPALLQRLDEIHFP